MNPIFLDTSGLIALTDKDDYWHSAVEAWQTIVANRREMVTTQNLKKKTKIKTSKAAKPSSNSKPKVKAKATAEATKKAINKARHARI